MPKKDQELQIFKNFLANVSYYCEYFSKPLPDEEFILKYWKEGVPLDDLVAKFENESKIVLKKDSKRRGKAIP
jgi:hypothetical protein